MNSFLSDFEISEIGFKSVGKNVSISRYARIYNPQQICLGNNIRIDDFCILSGNIELTDYIHIAAYSALYGGKSGITIKDFANISSRVTIYAKSDDFSGMTMTNPLIPSEFKNVIEKSVEIEKHVVVGSNCVVLPGAKLSEGSSFGAMTLINGVSIPWSINVGIPFNYLKERKRNLLELERKFMEVIHNE